MARTKRPPMDRFGASEAVETETPQVAATVPAKTEIPAETTPAAPKKISTLEERNYKKEMRIVGLNELKPSDQNFFGRTRADINKMKASIKANGILEMPMVRAIEPTADDPRKYEILSGHTRYFSSQELIAELEEELAKAKTPAEAEVINAKLAHLQKIKVCLVNVKSSDEALEIIIDSNYQKRTLTAVEKAKSIYHKIQIFKNKPEYQQLVKNKERSEKVLELLKNVHGLAISMAYTWNRVGNVTEKLFNFLIDKGIGVHGIEKFGTLSEEEQLKVLELDPECFVTSKIAKLRMGMSLEQVMVTLGEDTTIVSKTINYNTGSLKNVTDQPILVFVEKGREEAFKAKLAELYNEFHAYTLEE